MSVSTFRVLVVIYVGVTILSWSLPYAPVRLTPEMHELLARSGAGSAEWLTNPALYWISLGATLASAIGMFLFHSWGRSLGVAVVVVFTLLQPFGGVRVDAPFDGFVNSIGGTLNIILLTVSFLPPVADRFRARAGTVPAEEPRRLRPEVAAQPPEPAAELVVVLTTSDDARLAVLESVFREHGIEFAIQGDQVRDLFGAGRIGGYNFALGPARVMVGAHDVSLARTLIGELEGDSPVEREGV